MESDRATLATRWQECADYGMPQNNQITVKKNLGAAEKDLYDTTAEDSNIQLAAGLYSYMFPAESKAFMLEVDDPDLAENEEVKVWLDKVTNAIHKFLIKCNFRQAFFEFLKSLGCFGTGVMYVEKGKTMALNFINHYIAQIFIATNYEGVVDTVFRKYECTARQAAKEFKDPGPKVMEAAKDPKRMNEKFTFVHAVYQRDDFDPDKNDPLKYEWASVYVNVTEQHLVSESGYKNFPFMVTRFDKDASEDYGRSPMMKMLPDVKMINQMAKTQIKGWDKMCDPPIILPDDGSIWPLATQPGGVIYKSPGGDSPEWFEFKGNLQGMEEAIIRIREKIRSGFFLDLFDALIDRRNMTATEVMARVEQKIRLLTPIIGRLQSEFFNPLIHRILYILAENKKIPPAPEVLGDAEYSVQYLGRLALALKTLESEGFVKTIEQMRVFLEVGMTDFLDNFHIDQVVRDTSRNNGSPSVWLKELQLRDGERAARQQAMAQQQMMAAAPDLTKAVKNLSGKPEEGSIAQEMMNA